MTYDKELNSCTSGSVEILGLHATVAPRRPHGQAAPILESFSFVPYFSDDAVSNHNSHEVLKGISFAKDNLSKLINSPSTSSEQKQLLEELLKDSVVQTKYINGITGEPLGDVNGASENGLFEHLVKVFSSESDALLTRSELHSDETFGLLRSRPLLDVVVENSPSEKKLLFIEVDATSGCVYETAATRLATEPGLKFEYLISGPGVDTIDKSSLESIGVEAIQWDTNIKPIDRYVWDLCDAKKSILIFTVIITQ